jgi:hypothetical protein
MSTTEWSVPKKKRDTRNYMRCEEATALGKQLNISGFAAAMVSTESRALQDQGFVFDRVLRGDEEYDGDNGEKIVSIDNKYGDYLVFVQASQ